MACFRVNPDVSVLALLSFSQSGSVTYLATRECLDLISGKGSDMLDDVESIIESRARSADLSVNNYYDFLYSFHIMKENYRWVLRLKLNIK